MHKGYFGADKPTQRETDAATIALEVLDLRMESYRPSDAGKAKAYELLVCCTRLMRLLEPEWKVALVREMGNAVVEQERVCVKSVSTADPE
ncbi:MAG: hypothetical protein E6Q97_10005 [Desulfurellales bacterium]|nr:MAG: hypothetical protein E6Q97_10005 [Desulfurellales bacterium]